MEDLISRKKLLADLCGVADVLTAQGDPFLSSVMHRAIAIVKDQPTALKTDDGKAGGCA